MITDQLGDQDQRQESSKGFRLHGQKELGAHDTADDRERRDRPVTLQGAAPMTFADDADQVDRYRRHQGEQDRGAQVEPERQQWRCKQRKAEAESAVDERRHQADDNEEQRLTPSSATGPPHWEQESPHRQDCFHPVKP